LTKEIVIKQLSEKHNNKYDYSLFIEYLGTDSKIDIICPIHGVFNQQISHHKKGVKCPKCAIDDIKEQNSLSKEDFVIKANSTHHHLFDYSLVVYVNSQTKVKIICKEHGIFEQTSNLF